MTDRTFVIIKPDAVERGLTGAIIDRFLRKGLVLRALEMRTATDELTDRHYADKVGEDFYPGLREFFTSGPLVALVLEGEEAVAAGRALIGPTNPIVAPPGTIRGDYCTSMRSNAVHASDSAEAAAREIAIWFPGLA